jgi:hypothetical protein
VAEKTQKAGETLRAGRSAHGIAAANWPDWYAANMAAEQSGKSYRNERLRQDRHRSRRDIRSGLAVVTLMAPAVLLMKRSVAERSHRCRIRCALPLPRRQLQS